MLEHIGYQVQADVYRQFSYNRVKNYILQKILPSWRMIDCIPSRVIICLMMFTACWTNYMCRLQMPILAVPMIYSTGGNNTAGACAEDEFRFRRAISWLDPGAYLEDYIMEERLKAVEDAADRVASARFRRGDNEPRPADAPLELANGKPFGWNPRVRAQLIAAYSYGNVPGNFLGGIMVLRCSPKKAILCSSIVAVIACLGSPIFAQLHWGLLVIARFIVGVTGGITFPACHTLVAKWSPPHEKSRFVWSLLGGTFGTILVYPMVAVIVEFLGWEYGWYIPSGLMFVWIIFWAMFTYDSPDEHPGITAEEKEYILTSQAGTVAAKKPSLKNTPIKEICTSLPFISLIFCHFGNLFLLFFYQNEMMLYLTKALGFQLTKGTITACIPWAGRMFFGFFFSWIGDTMKSDEVVSITALRKGATIFSHLIPGVFLILVGYVGCNLFFVYVFLFLALSFNGAASIANLSNNQDLSPNYAGFLYGIMNTIGCTSGMIISPLVEEIAGKYGNPIEKWEILFWITAAVCIGCMVIFILGGSGNIQPWNEVKSDAEGG